MPFSAVDELVFILSCFVIFNPSEFLCGLVPQCKQNDTVSLWSSVSCGLSLLSVGFGKFAPFKIAVSHLPFLSLPDAEDQILKNSFEL